jgi:hypothetical protein
MVQQVVNAVEQRAACHEIAEFFQRDPTRRVLVISPLFC